MQAHDDASLIETERLRAVRQQSPLTLLVSVLNAILTAIVLSPVFPHPALIAWAAAIVAISVARWIAWRLASGRDPHAARRYGWVAVSVLGSLATGLAWGFGAAMLFPAGGIYQLFLAFVIGGMCAGTTAVNSAYLPAVLAFIVPATLPLAACFFVAGSLPSVVSAAMIVVFAAALSLTSLRGHRAFGQRLRMQFVLERHERDLAAANERLRKEMAERRIAEAGLYQAQKMEAIGHLTGGIAHDFNNLLTAVIGNLELLRALIPGNHQIFRYATAAQLAAERGARLTASLLSFARRQSLRAESVNINVLLREFEPVLRQAVSDLVRLDMLLDPMLPACEIDPAHFQSAILNLVINAEDAMHQGGTLQISTGVGVLAAADLIDNPDARPGTFVSVTVQDSGTGMDAAVLARAFEPFFTTKAFGQGSGLGLSQVYGFVRQSGGHVTIRSQPGAGTCATLFLPTRYAAEAASAPEATALPEPP